jgi:hypothetical protein
MLKPLFDYGRKTVGILPVSSAFFKRITAQNSTSGVRKHACGVGVFVD